jgi:hypothetical protein
MSYPQLKGQSDPRLVKFTRMIASTLVLSAICWAAIAYAVHCLIGAL